MTPDELISYLDALGVPTKTISHDPVFTVEEARALRAGMPGGHCKSLFLKNKKGRMWLVTTLADTSIDLRNLGNSLGAGRVGFASAERLERHLGVTPGAVTPFGVVVDTAGDVSVALERAMLDHDPLYFHPLVNDRTTAISPQDLLRFLTATNHPPRLLDAGEL